MTNAMNALDGINQDLARSKVLAREIAMLRAAQPNLRGIPARQNLRRISDRQSELESIAYLIELSNRVGADEIARCEAASIA
jgi:hypothetical protein